jgi:phosphoenolpyruvate-protein kinase (PTS system EI component)
VRHLDIGGDKGLPYLGNDGEINSFLGLRGIRLLLANPNLLLTQLRVVLRLRQEFNVRLLIPMVSTAREVQEVRERLQECQQQLEHKLKKKLRPLPVGAMIETPAAVLGVGKLLEVSDFISIGTNDLIQYTMAAGRGNPEVASYYDLGDGVILPFIRQVAQAADRSGTECSVCGEMASNQASLADLASAGIRCFSVTPARIPELKEFAAGLP